MRVDPCSVTPCDGLRAQMGSPDARWLAPQAHMERPRHAIIQVGFIPAAPVLHDNLNTY